MFGLHIKRSIDPKAITQQRIDHLQGLVNDQNERLVRLNEESTKLSAIYTRLAHDAAGSAETREAEMRRDEKVNEYVKAMARQRELVGQMEEEKVIFDNLKAEVDENKTGEMGRFVEGESSGSHYHEVKGKQLAYENSGQSELGGKVDEYSTVLLQHTDTLGHLSTVQEEHTKELSEHADKLTEHDKKFTEVKTDIQGLKKGESGSKDETHKNDIPVTSTLDSDLSQPPPERPPPEPKDPAASPAKESDDKNPSGPEDREEHDQKFEPSKAAEEGGSKDDLEKDDKQDGSHEGKNKNPAPDVTERLNEIETKHDTLHNQVQEVDKKTAKVEQHDLDITKIVGAQGTHIEKIESHAAKLEHHDQKIDTHDQKIEHHDQKIEHHDQNLKKVEDKTNEHGDKIGQLIETTTNHREKIAVHNVHLDYHKDDITNLKHKADTQATTTASFEAQLGHNSERLREVDQVKHGLNDMGKQLVQYKSDIQHLRDRTQLLETDVRKIEGHDERLKSLQSNVADYKGLITDVQTAQQQQTAQLLELKETTEKPVAVAVPKGKVNIGLIAGLGGGVLGIGALAAGAYIWWTKWKTRQNGSNNTEEVSDEEGQETAAAAINTDVIDGQEKSDRRVRLPRVRGGARLHAREWHADTTFNAHSSL